MIYLWFFIGVGLTLLIKFLRKSYKKQPTLKDAALEWFIGSPESTTTSITYIAVAGVICAWYGGALEFGGEAQDYITVHPVMALCLGSLCELIVPPATMRIVTFITGVFGGNK